MLSVRVRAVVGLILRLLIAAALIYWVLRKANLRVALQTLSQSELWAIAGGMVLMFANLVLKAWKWQVLLRADEIHFSLPKLTILYFIGTFFNTFLPTNVGGDVKRVYDVAAMTSRGSSALASVFMDRGTTTYLVLLYGVIVILARWELLGGAAICGPVLVAFLGALATVPLAIVAAPVLTRRRIGIVPEGWMRKLDTLTTTVLRLCRNPLLLLVAFVLSLASLVAIGAMYWVVIAGLGITAPVEAVVVVVPMVLAITSLPLSINGIGLREGAFIYLLTRYGVTASAAMAVSLGVFALIVIAGLCGGLLFVFEGLRKGTHHPSS